MWLTKDVCQRRSFSNSSTMLCVYQSHIASHHVNLCSSPSTNQLELSLIYTSLLQWSMMQHSRAQVSHPMQTCILTLGRVKLYSHNNCLCKEILDKKEYHLHTVPFWRLLSGFFPILILQSETAYFATVHEHHSPKCQPSNCGAIKNHDICTSVHVYHRQTLSSHERRR